MDYFGEWMQRYYGMDILAMVFGAASVYALGTKTRSGFITGVISQIAWLLVNYWAHILAGIVLNVILIILNVRGYVLWRKKKR